MAYPKVLNTQYKAEKAAGITLAKSFKEWNENRLDLVEVESPKEPEVVEVVTVDDLFTAFSQLLSGFFK